MPNATYRVAGHCHGGRDQAAVLIFNAETNVERAFTVHNFFLREAQPTPSARTTWNLYKTTAQSGGSSLQADPMDSTNSALPSQVSISTDAQVTTGAIVYPRDIFPNGGNTVGWPSAGGMSGTGWSRVVTSEVLDYKGFSDTQAYTLREGEGLAFVGSSTSDCPQPATWQALIQIRVGGTALYSINASIAPALNTGWASVGIFNGSGSGVVIEVMSINLINPGAPTIATITSDSASCRIARIFGYSGGVAVTPVAMGGANIGVPSQLQIVRNMDWNPLNVVQNLLNGNNGISMADLGVPGTTIMGLAQQRQVGTIRHFLGYTNNLFSLSLATTGAIGTIFRPGAQGILYNGGVATVSRFRLNPGEGFAFIIDNCTLYANYWFEAEITHEPPQVSGTSSVGFSS